MERARIILGCLAGRSVTAIARRCQTRPHTVIKWRTRFAEKEGPEGTGGCATPRARRIYDEDFRNRVLVWSGGRGFVGSITVPMIALRLIAGLHALFPL